MHLHIHCTYMLHILSMILLVSCITVVLLRGIKRLENICCNGWFPLNNIYCSVKLYLWVYRCCFTGTDKCQQQCTLEPLKSASATQILCPLIDLTSLIDHSINVLNTFIQPDPTGSPHGGATAHTNIS